MNSLIKVFRADLTGIATLECVRLLNRMIKEHRFNVHPEVLSCPLYLRLKTELGVHTSETRADKPGDSNGKRYSKGRAKGKATDQPYLSKKARKVQKERVEIEKEMREAVAEVDKEQRESNVSSAMVFPR